MDNTIQLPNSNLWENDDIHQKNELVARLRHARKENENLTSMVKIMTRNYDSLHIQLMKQQKEYLRSSLKSMAKDLKLDLAIAGDDNDDGFPKQEMDLISLDSMSSQSESSEKGENKSMSSLPWKKRKINHVLEHETENSFMDSTDLSNEKAVQGYATMAAAKKITTVRRRAETATVSDDCHWRKYGQKMIRNSPWPRGYFKCAMSPSCPVKKQVQRCTQDSAFIITTYDGEHNHFLSPLAMAAMNGRSEHLNNATLIPGNHLSFPASVATISSMGSSLAITLDLTENPNPKPNSIPLQRLETVQPQFPAGMAMHQWESEQNDPLASLKADPKFTAALAAAIASSMFKMGAPTQGTTTTAQASPSVIQQCLPFIKALQ